MSIECGLLQGDNLSQTFFSLVINNVVNHLKHCKFHLYADDQSVYLHTELGKLHEAVERVNADIEIINQWMTSHGLELNPNKTQTIIIGSQHI